MKTLVMLFILIIPVCGYTQELFTPDLVAQAEAAASTEAHRVLETSRTMIDRKIIIRGACWDFIDEAFRRAGFPEERRETVFKSTTQGPYAEPHQIKPGDWLYLINHAYNNFEHSGIFVAWTNKKKKEALLISYHGENKNRPARFKTYILKSVYNIIRPR